MDNCHHNPFEVFLEIPPFVWIVNLWTEYSIKREFKNMEKKGYESYVGCRYDKKGSIIASGVVCWRKKEIKKMKNYNIPEIELRRLIIKGVNAGIKTGISLKREMELAGDAVVERAVNDAVVEIMKRAEFKRYECK